jgi:hypothetical protein
MAALTDSLWKVQCTQAGKQILYGLLLVCWVTAATSQSLAETYSYVDDQGTVVFTDDLKSIAPRYRQRVKTVQEAPRPNAPLLKIDQLPFPDVGKGFTIAGLTPAQSRTLVTGFCAAIVMFAVMMLTGSSALRLLMRWLLILLAIGTTASIYFSNDALTGKATVKAKELERRQQEKAQQVERMEPAADEAVR